MAQVFFLCGKSWFEPSDLVHIHHESLHLFFSLLENISSLSLVNPNRCEFCNTYYQISVVFKRNLQLCWHHSNKALSLPGRINEVIPLSTCVCILLLYWLKWSPWKWHPAYMWDGRQIAGCSLQLRMRLNLARRFMVPPAFWCIQLETLWQLQITLKVGGLN